MNLGASGEYPQGKLNESDEGELIVAVAADKQTSRVLLQFGKSIRWIGMDAAQARAVAQMLIQKANELPVQTSGLDWSAALAHFRRVRRQYQELDNSPGVNTALALEYVFRPLSERYHRGERSPELFREMMTVE